MGGGWNTINEEGVVRLIYIYHIVHYFIIMLGLFLLRLAARPGFVMIDDVSNDTEIRSKVSSGWQLLLC